VLDTSLEGDACYDVFEVRDLETEILEGG
jgi:hypothetical protein